MDCDKGAQRIFLNVRFEDTEKINTDMLRGSEKRPRGDTHMYCGRAPRVEERDGRSGTQ